MPKPGYITASVFTKCLTKSVGKTVQRECCRIACERLGVQYLEEQFDLSGIRAIEWGAENEGLAVSAYEAHTFSVVESAQEFFRLPDRLVGGHPDGLVGDDGIIEIKCPNSDNHLMNIAYGAQVDGYQPQIQAYLWITGRQWCDFISFDPRFPEDLQLYVERVERDEELIDTIRTRADEMEEIISGMVEKARPGFRFSLNGIDAKGDQSEALYNIN